MKPIIFIPGIEATNLVNANSFGFDSVWNAFDTLGTSLQTKFMGPYLEDSLQEDPLYDVKIESIIERESIARLPYEKSILKLYNNLNPGKKVTTPIYLFGYDWRLSNMENGRRLGIYIDYLKRKLSSNMLEGFHFITHSMGALVLNSYLDLQTSYDHIQKIIFCAPPFLGSPYALIHMIKGDGGFKSFLNNIFGRNEDIRKVVRTFPSIYELLPFYTNAVTYDDGVELDFMKKDCWQPNIYDGIKSLFDNRLNNLQHFRNRQGAGYLSSLPLQLRQRMVVLAGINDATLIYLKAEKKDNLILLDRIKKADLEEQANDPGIMGGDGTVPAISSTCYKDSIRTIAIQKESFLEELGNNIDFHGFFIRDSRVQNIIERFLKSSSNAAETDGEKLLPLKGKASQMWYSVADTVVNLSPF